MFSSVSSCAPNSQAITEFVSNADQTLDIWANITVAVNSTVITTRPIAIKTNDRVRATIATPAAHLGYRFIPYTLSGRQQCFAVVNRNNYTPTVKTTESVKKWYNYPVTVIEHSWSDGSNLDTSYIGGGVRQTIDIDQLHVKLKHRSNAVDLYGIGQASIATIGLPAGPIDYRKVNLVQPSGTYTQELLVLCNDGKLYRIDFKSNVTVTEQFNPGTINTFNFDDLPYQEDVPGGGSFSDQARENYIRSLFPSVTALDATVNYIWLAGFSTVYVINRNFTLVTTMSVANEEIIGLACIDQNSAIVTTRTHRVYRVTISNPSVLLHSSTALGSPGTLPDGSRVAVPDPNNQRLLIFNNSSLLATWSTQGFAPAYAKTFDQNLYVTGHDSNQVLKYLSDNIYQVINFDKKVTTVDVVHNNILATHTLQSYKILELAGIKKVIPFELESRSGGLNHIGTKPQQVIMLGEEAVQPVSGLGITTWSNGIANGTISTGDYFSVSFKASQNGDFRSVCVIGENAFDFTVNVSSSSSILDYFSQGAVSLLKMTQPFGVVIDPDVGSLDNGVSGPIPIGFNFVFWGRTYNSLYVTTNGVVYFGNDYYANQNPVFGDLALDSLYVEPRNLYQGYPINNTDPLNIGNGRFDANITPGLYIKQQDFTEFRSFRLRWAGTTMASYPLGNTLTTVYTTTNHPELLVPTLDGINLNDYVSGGNVLVSTQVTDRINYLESNVEIYWSSGLTFLTATPVTIKKYSQPKSGEITYYSFYNNLQTTTILGNRFLSQSVANNLGTVVIDGIINPAVTLLYVFEFPYNQNGSLSTLQQVRARSITTQSSTITSLARWGNNPANSIFVSQTDYQKVYVNQSVYAANVTSAIVTSKQYTKKTFTLLADYSQISEGYLNTVYTPPVFDSNGNVIVNGFWTNTLIQGTTVTFTLNTSNVSPGSTFPYTITTTAGQVLFDDFLNSPSLSGQLTLNGAGTSTIQFRAQTNFVTEGVEAFLFTVSNLSVLSDSTLSHEITLTEDQVSIPANLSTSISFDEYKLNTSISQYIPFATVLNIDQTNLVFDNPLFSTGLLYGNVTYKLHSHSLFETPLLPGLGTGANDTYQNSKTLVNFFGNFAAISSPATISTGTSILFKANIAHPAVAYEVGFYTGRNYQFIEYFYNTVHHANSNIGIASATGLTSNLYVRTTAENNTSIVFGSSAADGIWSLLGIGSFSSENQGFEPRHPRIFRYNWNRNSELRYDLVIDQKFPTYLDVRYSLDYGILYRNEGYDFGDIPAKTGDLLSVVIPFGTSKRPVSVILGIGNYQVILPAVPESDIATQLTTSFENYSSPQYTIGNVSLTVPVTGEYMIPQVFISAVPGTGIEYEFIRTRAGANVALTSIYNDFQAGDILTIRNIITSRRRYDIREITVAGPRFLRFSTRTSSTTEFLPLNYGMLDQPFVRYVDEFYDPLYQTGNIKLLTTSGALTSKLFVTGPDVQFVVNGNRDTNKNFIESITTGANVSLEWAVPSYFESNLIIYQIQPDIDNGNVYVPIGSWNINNRSVSSAVLLDPETQINVKAATEQLEDTFTLFKTQAPDMALDDNEYTFSTTGLSPEILDNAGAYLDDYKIIGEYIIPVTQFTARTDEAWLSQGQRDMKGAIVSDYLSNDFQQLFFKIQESSDILRPTEFIGGGIKGTWLDGLWTQFGFAHPAIGEKPFTVFYKGIQSELHVPGLQSWSARVVVDTTSIQVSFITGPRINEKQELAANFTTAAINSDKLPIHNEMKSSYTWIPGVYRSDNISYLNSWHESRINLNYQNLVRNYVTQTVTSAFMNNGEILQNSISNIDIAPQYLVGTLDASANAALGHRDPTTSVVKSPQEFLDLVYDFRSFDLDPEYIKEQLIAPPFVPHYIKDSVNVVPLTSQIWSGNVITPDMDPEWFKDNLITLDIDPLFIRDQLIDPDFDSLFISPNDVYVNTDYELVTPPDIFRDFDPLFIRANDLYFDSDYQLVKPPDIYLDFDPLFVASNDRYFDTDFEWITPPDIYLDFLPNWYVSNDRYIERQALLLPGNDRLIAFNPFVYQDHTTNITLLPEFDPSRPRYSLLDLKFQPQTYYSSEPEFVLDKEPMWETKEWHTQGAFKTQFRFFADGGLEGNKWGSYEFVAYDQNRASTLVLFSETYGPGSFQTQQEAAAMAARYVSATAFQIMGTDYWNYRIHFDTKIVCVPRKGSMYPRVWLIRGG